MCELKKCRICLEEKPLKDFHKGLVCRSCRNEQQRAYRLRNAINQPGFVFDEILAMWVLTNARKPNRGPLKTIRAYSCAGVKTKEGWDTDDGEFMFIVGAERERVVTPLFGNPMVVYQSESNELLSNVRAKENTVERSEPEILEINTDDIGEFDAEWVKLRDRVMARVFQSKIPRYAGINYA